MPWQNITTVIKLQHFYDIAFILCQRQTPHYYVPSSDKFSSSMTWHHCARRPTKPRGWTRHLLRRLLHEMRMRQHCELQPYYTHNTDRKNSPKPQIQSGLSFYWYSNLFVINIRNKQSQKVIQQTITSLSNKRNSSSWHVKTVWQSTTLFTLVHINRMPHTPAHRPSEIYVCQ